MPTLTTYSRKRARPLFLSTADDDTKQESTHSQPLPLQPMSSNAASSLPRAGAMKSRKKPRLMQTTIDLGGSPQTACKTCGMEYTPSNAEDAALHRRFHDARVGGVDVSARCWSVGRIVARCKLTCRSTGMNVKDDAIFEVCGEDGLVMRRAAERVLEVVEGELGAIHIAADRLWGSDKTSNIVQGQSKGPHYRGENGNLYKVYLYVKEKKCIGLCLAQSIQSARKVLDTRSPGSGSSSISPAANTSTALIGISRIWVSKEFRRLRMANELLETVQRNFHYGTMTSKTLVAFSQPTDSGAKLARKWYGRWYGWLVYDERDTITRCNDDTKDTQSHRDRA